MGLVLWVGVGGVRVSVVIGLIVTGVRRGRGGAAGLWVWRLFYSFCGERLHLEVWREVSVGLVFVRFVQIVFGQYCRLTLLILGLLAENAVTELRWGLLSTFPRPMPVTSSAQVFPRLFTVNNTLKLPVLHLNNDTRPVESNRTISLNGTLCFQITPTVDLELSPCVGLFPEEAVWSDRLNFTSERVNGSLLRGLWPARTMIRAKDNSGLLCGEGGGEWRPQPSAQPRCRPSCHKDFWPWTECQSPAAVPVHPFFTFSPPIPSGNVTAGVATNWTCQDAKPLMSTVTSDINSRHLHYEDPGVTANPFDLWLLCGEGGACLDLRPMAMLLGGVMGWGNGTWTELTPSILICQGQSSTYRHHPHLSVFGNPFCFWFPIGQDIMSLFSNVRMTVFILPAGMLKRSHWQLSFASHGGFPGHLTLPILLCS
ncbi:uncharacterized protein [Petaurus breviceps papuanus]|uniref:uncharacterized protein isoform X2 n=1 Tax=Petaurus breviceps papuanus TaxID=3040969 RepID=UPI0036D9B68A